MSLAVWEERYQQHPLWPLVDQVEEALNGGPELASDVERADAARIRFVLGYLREDGRAPLLVIPASTLDAAHTALSALQSQLNQWTTTVNAAYLADAAGPRTESLLEAMRGWPTSKDRYAKGVIAAAEGFQVAADARLEALSGGVTDLETRLAEAAETATQNREAAMVSAEALAVQITGLETTIATQKTRLDEALDRLGTTFAEAEAQRAEEHRLAMEDLRQSEADYRVAIDGQATKDRTHIEALTEDTVRDITALRVQAENLVNAVGLAGTATEYGKYAEQERRQANGWRWAAATSFAVAFVVFMLMLFGAFGFHLDGQTAWQVSVFRLTGSAGLLAFGVFAAAESRSHRKAERHAKHIQLDLAALEPFIANMPETEKAAIRAGAARRLFVDRADQVGEAAASSSSE